MKFVKMNLTREETCQLPYTLSFPLPLLHSNLLLTTRFLKEKEIKIHFSQLWLDTKNGNRNMFFVSLLKK